MKQPKWTIELLDKVLDDYGCKEKPELVWRRSKVRYDSSGTTYYKSNRIVITAGKERKGQKLTLLHEIAHWLSPQGEHHGKMFWDLAFDLYRKYKVPMRYALQNERAYRKQATLAYKRNLKNL